MWREVVELGANLQAIREVAGSRVEQPQVALLFDWTSWWAAELDSHPSADVDPQAELRRWHRALLDRTITSDVVGPADDLSLYRLLVVPVQYLMDDAALGAVTAFVEAGGVAVVTYFSAIVDEHDHVRLGGYPGGLRELLGLRIEEFFPLAADGTAPLTEFGAGRVWSELGEAARDTTVVAAYASGPVQGSPAVTRRTVGRGTAWYVGTAIDPVDPVLDRVLDDAGVAPAVADVPDGVEAVRRVRDGQSWVFLINHTDAAADVPVRGTDLISGAPFTVVAAGGVAVVRETP